MPGEAVQLDGRYVAEVLRARGVAPPDRERTAQFLATLDDHRQREVAATLRRIAMGVDEGDEMCSLVTEIRTRASASLSNTEAPEWANVERPEPQRTVAARRGLPPRPREAQLEPARELDATQFLRANGLHVYGKSAALKVELDRLGPKAGGSYTLQIEGARKHDGAFDWQRKIQFQLTRQELPRMACFLLGYGGSEIEFGNQGPSHDKALFVQDQGRHLFVKLRHTLVIPVPVEPFDVYAWGELCLLALHLNRPQVPPEAQLAMLRRLGAMERAKQA